jgi:hypothetical protein
MFKSESSSVSTGLIGIPMRAIELADEHSTAAVISASVGGTLDRH